MFGSIALKKQGGESMKGNKKAYYGVDILKGLKIISLQG